MSDALSEFEGGLKRVLVTLEPYLPELVLIGGWVPYLYRQYGGFKEWSSRHSMTREVDILVPRCVSPDNRPLLAELLEAARLKPKSSYGASAVWIASDSTGDEIEFLVPQTGPGRRDSNEVAVPGQPGIAALSLPDLGILERHTAVLEIPLLAAVPDRSSETIRVRVPSLGAYVLNKAVTFQLRLPLHGGSTNPKRAKDLLYLRDLAAAGREVVETIRTDLATLMMKDDRLIHTVDRAASHLEAIVVGRYDVDEVVSALQEREPDFSSDKAKQDVLGHLTDLFEIVSTYRSPAPSHDPED